MQSRVASTACPRPPSPPISLQRPCWCWRAATIRWRSPHSPCSWPPPPLLPGAQKRRRRPCRQLRCSPSSSSPAGRSISRSGICLCHPVPSQAPYPSRRRQTSDGISFSQPALRSSSASPAIVPRAYRIANLDASIPFAASGLLLGVLYALATESLNQRAPASGLAAAGAIFAIGAVGALALALTMALEKGWLTVALALMVAGIAWVADKRPLPALRLLAAAVAMLVMVRIAWEPRIVGTALGTTPIFNWLLYGYGLCAAAFAVGGHLLRRRADDAPARVIDSGAIVLTVLLAFFEIRH